MNREDVEFAADGTILRGWFYRTKSSTGKTPTVILAHGFSAVKEHGLAPYAEVFAAAGLNCLVYDNRNIGASDGLPRNEIDPVMQARDYQHAMSYLQRRDDVDADRIGIWGTSYTGGLVVNVAAVDRRVKCVVSQVPYINGLATFHRKTNHAERQQFYQLIAQEQQRIAAGESARTSLVCTYDVSEPESSPGNRTYDFFHAFGDNKAFDWPNEITIRSLALRLEYDCLGAAEYVSPTPLLMIVADDDTITPTDFALRAFELAGEPKALLLIEGDHYRPYLEAFSQASEAARDWFVAHLLGSS